MAECCSIKFDFMKIIRLFLKSLYPYYSRSQLTSKQNSTQNTTKKVAETCLGFVEN